MKNIIVFIVLCLYSVVSFGQRFYSTVFDQLPQSYQLYPRNEKNEASVPISGRIEIEGWSYFSLKVFRNNTLISYQKAPITYKGTLGTFAFKPTTIKAEKAEYNFKIYAVKGTDSLELVNRQNVVAGDVYVLTGQSNSTGFFRETKTNEFCRTFGKITDNYNTAYYNAADTLWALSNEEVYWKDVGPFGFAFQEYILNNFGIPTCLINAGFHWSSALQHATRTASNPADLTNGYGRMLYRLQKAGIDKSVKALIYRQGETEAYGEGWDFAENFDKFYKNLKIDLPSIKQIYAYQIDIINPAVDAAPKVREAQRVLKDKYSDVQVLPSIGTAGFDGLHYSDAGYTQNGQEVGRLVGRDFYQLTNTDNIDAPNLRKAYFSATNHKEITLTFDTGQVLTWNEKYNNFYMKDYIYLDGNAGNVVSGKASENKIILTLADESNASKISYLPSIVATNSAEYPYTGPYISNKKGMRALSFYEVAIDDTPLASTLTATTTGSTKIKLTWKAVANASNYVLERKLSSASTYEQITKTNANVLTFEDTALQSNTAYDYQVKVLYQYAESPYANVSAKTNALLASPTPSISVVYYNQLKLSWTAVANATSYLIERKTGNESFKTLATLDAKTTEFLDKNLNANTTYTYRVQALGNLTESLQSTIEGKTPALLTTPELRVNPISFNTIKVSWNSVSGATQYVLERKSDNNFVEIAKINATKPEYTDATLTENTNYTYRIKAFSSTSESLYSNTASGNTSTVLATEDEITTAFKLYPNPTHAVISISFQQQSSGKISIIDFSGSILYEEEIKNLQLHSIDVRHLKKGMYFLVLSNAEGNFAHKFLLE